MRLVAPLAIVVVLVVGVAWWIRNDKQAGPAPGAGPASPAPTVHSPRVPAPLDPVVLKSSREAAAPVEPVAPDEVPAVAPAITRTEDGAAVDVPFATFSGELVVPIAWNAERPRLAARRKDSAKSFTQMRDVEVGPAVRSGQLDTFSWRIFNLTPGPYEILSLDPPCALDATLDPLGTANLRLEVPPPARVIVQLVDSRTRVPVPARFLLCTPKRADGSLFPMGSHAVRNKDNDTYVVRAVPGEAQLTCPFSGGDYGEGKMSVTIHPGDNTFTMPLEKFAAVRLSLREGNAPFQPSQDHFDVREVDGAGSALVWDAVSETGVVIAKVTHPGRYRVKLKAPIAGYALPEEQLVDLASGTTTDVVIRLTKAP